MPVITGTGTAPWHWTHARTSATLAVTVTAGATGVTTGVTTGTSTLYLVAVTSGTGDYDPAFWGSWAWTAPPPWGLPQQQYRELAGRRLAARRAETVRLQVRERAASRALELLLSLLDDSQAESYQRHGWFVVQGSAGGWYRIRRDGQAGNVDELDEAGQRTATWCCHPPGRLPDADAHAAQLLHLQTDEPGFRRTGNRTPRRRLAAAV